ncbi:MAG: hypothetical protein ABSC23_03640 [Bryobacteraceae bacterium]|jgi:hypothetical protein
MPTPIWHGFVSDGRLHFEQRRQFDVYAATLEGKRFELTIRKERRHLSGNKRRYLHGVVIPIFAEYCGHAPAEMKVILKLKLLWDGETVDKAGLPVIPSTEDLDDAQYGEFIERIVQLAAECSCAIPPPREMAP